MIKVNDISKNDSTVFDDLAIGDCFITENANVIWKKVNIFADNINAIQITDNNDYLLLTTFDKNRVITKIEIASIDYREIK